MERRGGAAPYVTGGAPKGEATPLKTSSPTGARAYVTGPRGRTSLAPGASSALHPDFGSGKEVRARSGSPKTPEDRACISGKVSPRETVRAFRKDVTAKCYGGDVTQASPRREIEHIGVVRRAFLDRHRDRVAVLVEDAHRQ